MRIRWESPTEGWVKLNTDGSFVGSMGVAGYSGVARNEHGD